MGLQGQKELAGMMEERWGDKLVVGRIESVQDGMVPQCILGDGLWLWWSITCWW